MATYCIFRTDRIGDVVLTLPVASVIKLHDPSSRVLFCAREYTAGLLRLCPDVDEVIVVPEADTRNPISVARDARLRSVDVAVFAFPRPGFALAAVLAGIEQRVGTARRWYSMLFNHRRHERRRGGDAHERDYNVRLLDALGMEIANPPMPKLRIPPSLDGEARRVLQSAGLTDESRFVVLHPGSGASAVDWPADMFVRLGNALTSHYPDLRVLVTGATHEARLIRSLRDGIGDAAHSLHEVAALPELAAVLNRAQLVVANSTGPLHIAAALGVPVLGLYPFRSECNPRRWGPLGPSVAVLTPPKEKTCSACAKEACSVHDDMRRIAVEDALASTRRLLSAQHAG